MADEVEAGRRNQRCELLHQFAGLEDDLGGSAQPPRLRPQRSRPSTIRQNRSWTEAHVDGSAWRIAMVTVRYYAGLGWLFLRAPFAAALRLLRR